MGFYCTESSIFRTKIDKLYQFLKHKNFERLKKISRMINFPISVHVLQKRPEISTVKYCVCVMHTHTMQTYKSLF